MPDTLLRSREERPAARALSLSDATYHRQTPGAPRPAQWDEMEARCAAARPRLLRLARLRGIPADAVEDVAQETLLEAWRALGALRDSARLDAWLDGICRNVCRRFARSAGTLAARQGYLPNAEVADEAAHIPEPLAADPFEELERQDVATLVDRALGHLHPDARAALALRYLAGLPAAEVAARLGVGVNALDVRLSRARRELRGVLGGALRAEAAAFGLAPEVVTADDGAAGMRETRIWCPLCGDHRLLAWIDRASGEVHYFCPGCEPPLGGQLGHIAGSRDPRLLEGVSSPKPILSRLLATLTEHYINGLAAGEVLCENCGRLARLVPHMPEEAPERLRDVPGLHKRCPYCGIVDVTDVGRLTLDLHATQRFWRAHPRIRLLPFGEVEAMGRPAVVVRFESADGAARHTAVWARETLDVLAVDGDAAGDAASG